MDFASYFGNPDTEKLEILLKIGCSLNIDEDKIDFLKILIGEEYTIQRLSKSVCFENDQNQEIIGRLNFTEDYTQNEIKNSVIP